jgi:hypothetical protein
MSTFDGSVEIAGATYRRRNGSMALNPLESRVATP